MPDRSVKFKFVRFAMVGGLGFCVDGGLMTLLMVSGLEVLWARCISFSSAVTVTLLFNRLWTFESARHTGKKKEYLTYFFTQVVGAGINLSLFFILLDKHPLFRSIPLIPLAAGAGLSLMFTFLVSRKIVFRSGTADAVLCTGQKSNNIRYSKR